MDTLFKFKYLVAKETHIRLSIVEEKGGDILSSDQGVKKKGCHEMEIFINGEDYSGRKFLYYVHDENIPAYEHKLSNVIDTGEVELYINGVRVDKTGEK
jgi:hypothetical protein